MRILSLATYVALSGGQDLCEGRAEAGGGTLCDHDYVLPLPSFLPSPLA